jgi:hypothetical protein
MTSFPHSAGTARPYVWAPDQPPAYWNVGTCRAAQNGSGAGGRASPADSEPHCP